VSKTYETIVDKTREKNFFGRLTDLGFTEIVSLPKFSPVDFIARYKNKLYVIEYKHRNNEPELYPSQIISADKVKRGKDIARALYEGHYMYFVEFSNGVLWASECRKYVTKTGGRSDRGDVNDLGEYAFIDNDQFMELK
jgi:hypothetical protein